MFSKATSIDPGPSTPLEIEDAFNSIQTAVPFFWMNRLSKEDVACWSEASFAN